MRAVLDGRSPGAHLLGVSTGVTNYGTLCQGPGHRWHVTLFRGTESWLYRALDRHQSKDEFITELKHQRSPTLRAATWGGPTVPPFIIESFSSFFSWL
jgi:hypothetical protein